MRKKSRTSLLFVTGVVLVLAMMVSACSGNNSTNQPTGGQGQTATSNPESTETTDTAKLDPVELTWYFPNTIQNMKDIELVQAEMNKIIQEEINATIKLMPLDWGAYDQKMNVMTGAGEKFDLMFTAPWSNNYFQNVSREALLPLDELLDKYAPTLKETVPASVWDATRVKGKIYGAINWQIVAMPYGTGIEKKYAEKYNVNLDEIDKYEDFEPYLEAWNESYPPLVYRKDGADPFTSQPPYFRMDSIGEDSSVGWISLDDTSMKVFNQFESTEFKNFVELMHKWYKAGYFPKDAALQTSAQANANMKAGRGEFMGIGSPIKPGVEAESKAALNRDIVVKPLSEAIITTNRAIATMTGISATSDNPERAMMFLELINSNKGLYNLLSNGIEGKHYKIVSDNVIEKVVENNGYNPGTDWMFGNQFNAYYTSKEMVGVWEQTIEMNKNAVTSPLLGFSFDPELVKTELAQSNAVFQQYKDALLSGTADPEKTLPEFLDKLEKSGANKVIEEKQKQIDAWKNAK
ncbi:ABC transporter substrate-binding protein [Paenibacillus nasutitermitis]|uniref:ABC transporter substrate-binding protein n=1 Tax=Paenibacillus nasutitermitis TaxID=1652958 RepID=A0A917E5F2_9BACL|nr:ABC transporter substrate-binding protein [Paenibacillus nasutitermitis]GGE02514.1 ABC transporter substrate-binding protein [Paenibacillus nasutitermitis]